MADKFAGGCDHALTHANNDPLDIYVYRYSIYNRVTGQHSTSVVFFAWPVRAC